MSRGLSVKADGFSLLIVLVLLVVLSILGIAVLRSSAMQERMSGNLRDRALAMQATEAAMVFARNQLNVRPTIANAANEDWNTLVPVLAHCTGLGICASTDTDSVTWQTGPTLGGTDAAIPDTATEYWIEYLGFGQPELDSCNIVRGSSPPPSCFSPIFRITARSRATGRAEVVMQSNVIFKLQTL